MRRRGHITSANNADAPVEAAEFAVLMARLGPFEKNPQIAVAVSGGADSMALLHLAAEWAAAKGGSATALTVDHGLRPEAAEEGRQVAAWAQGFNIPHYTLLWTNPEPKRAALQERARQARYTLLDEAAQRLGILHILVAHHAGDQAETLIMRKARDSGDDGMAGMASIVELPQTRLLRPFLTLPKKRLIATCLARGQAWLEDPSNRNQKFERVRVRLQREDSTDALLAAAGLQAQQRAALDQQTSAFLALNAELSEAGQVTIQFDKWRAAHLDIQRRSLMQAIRVVGGKAYAPRRLHLEMLLQRVLKDKFSRATLSGCLISKKDGKLVVTAENRPTRQKKPLLSHYPLSPARFPVV